LWTVIARARSAWSGRRDRGRSWPQALERQDDPPQKTGFAAGHAFLDGDGDFGGIVSPTAQNLDLLLQGKSEMIAQLLGKRTPNSGRAAPYPCLAKPIVSRQPLRALVR
jgi:hypothetical protein